MRKLICASLLLVASCSQTLAQDLGEIYISKWKEFYPTKAEKSGMHSAIFNYENLNAQNVDNWLDFNNEILRALSQPDVDIDRIDARLLRVQAQSEVDLYETLAQHQQSLRLYSRLISTAISSVQKADYLLASEKAALYCKRLEAITNLALASKANLKDVPKSDLESGLKELYDTQNFLENQNSATDSIIDFSLCNENRENALDAINSLKTVSLELLEDAEASESILGEAEYNRQLQLYTDSSITSKELEKMALAEIETVKGIMAEVSKQYLSETYPDKSLPKTDAEVINNALADMEKDVPISSSDYLQFWQQLAAESVDFIQENNIATLPEFDTLRIQNAPESAGPAARIGWVASAPPFHPNPVTTLNLPSIPESLPKQEQNDFWASFNKPFNRMIVIHELYPGHYMQLKISRETPHPIRLLFPYGIYIEGWATFTEKVLLDAGWQKEDRLTLLAHLRKRLENANRAYTSVQVHSNGWDREKVLQFSTETSLLAPQFAKSLWGRLINSPLQMTSYFLGRAEFIELFEYEKKRLGADFNLKFFMDTIIKAGPIPIDEFYMIFEQAAVTE